MAKEKAAAAENTASDVFEDSEDSLVMDLTGVQEMSFEPLPKGRYPVEVVKVEFTKGKTSGKPMFNIQYKVDAEEGTPEAQYNNRRLFQVASFSEGALPGTKATLAKLDTDLVKAAFDPREVASSGQLLGKRAVARVDVEDSEEYGKRNTVKGLLSASAGGEAKGAFFS
jgi:hypothetical protein